MADQWYYARNNQKHGPLTGQQLRQAAATGQLQPTDMVWKEGMQKWVPASSIKGLFPPPQAAAGLPRGAPSRQTKADDPAPAQARAVSNALGTEPSHRLLPRKAAWVVAAAGAGACVLGVCVVGVVLGLSRLGRNTPEGTNNQGNTAISKADGTQAKQDGFTARVLALDPSRLKKLRGGNPVPKGAKPDYSSRSVGDVLQALSLLTNSPLRGVSDSENVYAKYRAGLVQSVPPDVWEKVFDSPKAQKEGKRGDLTSYRWTIQCSDDSVIVFGNNMTPTEIVLQTVWWNPYIKEFCVTP